MSARAKAEEYLRGLSATPDGNLDLAEAALALAVLDQPQSNVHSYRAHLEQLAIDVASRVSRDAPLREQVVALNAVILQDYGYSGDDATYDDLQNANLIRVIDRRKGLPVALGIIYIQTARAQSWSADGLSFPGHFLMRLQQGGDRVIIDPFHGGQVREAADLREMLKMASGLDAELTSDHYAAVGNRDVLIRLQNNLKARHLQAERYQNAAAVVDSMLMFSPDRPQLWREFGLLQARINQYRAAIEAFERVLSLSDDKRICEEAVSVLGQLRSKLN